MNKEIEKDIRTKINNLTLLNNAAVRRRDQTEAVALGRELAKANEQRRVAHAITRIEDGILKAMKRSDDGQASGLREQLVTMRAALAESLGIPVRALQE